MTNTESFFRSLFGVASCNVRPIALAVDVYEELIFSQHIPIDDIHVTKQVYPLVAAQMKATTKTTSRRVERLAHLCWDALVAKGMVETCIGPELRNVPTPAVLLGHLAVYLRTGRSYASIVEENAKFLFHPSALEGDASSNAPYISVLLERDRALPVKEMMRYPSVQGFSTFPVCPCCHTAVEGERPNFCCICGQRLDWSHFRDAREILPREVVFDL